jgi:hypothetical protein
MLQFTSRMDVNEKGYFGKDKDDQIFMQKLVLHQWLSEGIDSGLTHQEIYDSMKEEMYWFEEEERYEACALMRDSIELFKKEFEERNNIVFK